MTRPFRYGVGSGRQGTAVGFHLATWGAVDRVLLADHDMKTAAQASARVNQLSGREVAFPRQVDVGDSQLMAETLASVDVVVCAVPYSKILTCTRAAMEAGTSLVDLGGHTETVLQ